jgi:hypothetical protein
VTVAVRSRRAPAEPWWTHSAVAALETLLCADDRAIEWGSGRSTVWLAQRTARVNSVEHDAAWFRRVETLLEPHANAVVQLASDQQSYVGAIDSIEAPLTVAVVDGIHRAECILAAAPRLENGGLLVLDNVERYLPNRSRSPESIGAHHEGPLWKEVEAVLGSWRRLWTSNGVWDTAIFIKR